MTFAQFTKKHPELRQGQAFMAWVKYSHKESIDDKELFNTYSDYEAWNLINLRYSKFLSNLV